MLQCSLGQRPIYANSSQVDKKSVQCCRGQLETVKGKSCKSATKCSQTPSPCINCGVRDTKYDLQRQTLGTRNRPDATLDEWKDEESGNGGGSGNGDGASSRAQRMRHPCVLNPKGPVRRHARLSQACSLSMSDLREPSLFLILFVIVVLCP
jgi:hypothetical protein